MGTVQTTADMLTTEDAYCEVTDRVGVREVSDGAARAIAALWQCPGAVGNVLASLASGRPVDVTDLLDDIHATRRQDRPGQLDGRALDMLATWALNRGRGE